MKATAHRIAYGRVLLIDDDANMKRRITQELTQKVTYIPHPCCCTPRLYTRQVDGHFCHVQPLLLPGGVPVFHKLHSRAVELSNKYANGKGRECAPRAPPRCCAHRAGKSSVPHGHGTKYVRGDPGDRSASFCKNTENIYICVRRRSLRL